MHTQTKKNAASFARGGGNTLAFISPAWLTCLRKGGEKGGTEKVSEKRASNFLCPLCAKNKARSEHIASCSQNTATEKIQRHSHSAMVAHAKSTYSTTVYILIYSAHSRSKLWFYSSNKINKCTKSWDYWDTTNKAADRLHTFSTPQLPSSCLTPHLLEQPQNQ